MKPRSLSRYAHMYTLGFSSSVLTCACSQVDPARLDKGEDAKKNFKFLMSVLSSLLDRLYNSADECPTSLRTIFQHVQQEVIRKFPDDPVVRYTGVSGFLFLRFLCASILGPKLFDLKDGTVLPPRRLSPRALTWFFSCRPPIPTCASQPDYHRKDTATHRQHGPHCSP
jgi:hypothetical protein